MKTINEFEFSIHGPMKCGSYEAEKRIYKLLIGKSGKRWLVSVQTNEADNIYVEGNKNSDGFGGRTLNFELENGEKLDLKGPWHSNSTALFEDTGYDIRNKHLTFGVIALDRKYISYNKPDIYIDVLYKDEDFVVGEFERIEKMAQEFSNKLNKKVAYGVKSWGGGSSGWKQPIALENDSVAVE